MGYDILPEYFSKTLFSKFTDKPVKIVQITPDTDLNKLIIDNPWLLQDTLVCKVDSKIKGRGKLGLVKVGWNWKQCVEWFSTISYNRFIIEPQMIVKKEHYLSI
jgi:succinyl-CoA synthetase beta subunit